MCWLFSRPRKNGQQAPEGLLTTLLHVCADEVLRVLLEHVVDLVEDRVHVLTELLAAFLTGSGGVVRAVVAVATALALLLFLGHLGLPLTRLTRTLPSGTDKNSQPLG